MSALRPEGRHAAGRGGRRVAVKRPSCYGAAYLYALAIPYRDWGITVSLVSQWGGWPSIGTPLLTVTR